MSITAVRLRERDKRKGYLMKTYFSANSRSKYTAGEGANPSPFRVVNSPAEIEELRGFPQFEILEFNDLKELEEFTQQEMEERARMGLSAVRAAILAGAGASVKPKVITPRKSANDRLPPAATAIPSDPSATNVGRRPQPKVIKDREEERRPLPTQPIKKVEPQPKTEPAKPKPTPNLEGKTKKQLLAMANKMGLDVTPQMKKADIEAAILKRSL